MPAVVNGSGPSGIVACERDGGRWSRRDASATKRGSLANFAEQINFQE